MASGANLQAKVTKLLGKVTATSRTVSFRTVTQVGGNGLLGVGGSVATVDVVCVPQPTVELVTTATADVGSSGLLELGDYRLTFTGAVPEATLKASLLLYGDEVLKIVMYEPFAFDSVVAAWQVTARAVN